MLHNLIHPRTAKNPQRLEPQGFANFAFYIKHMDNLYYTPVFAPVRYGIAGVFLDDGSKNGERNGCCTHNHTPRNPTYCHTAFPTLSHIPFSHPTIPHPPLLYYPLYFSSINSCYHSHMSQLQTFIIFSCSYI